MRLFKNGIAFNMSTNLGANCGDSKTDNRAIHQFNNPTLSWRKLAFSWEASNWALSHC